MKKNSKSAMKKEQRANRAKAQRPVQREPKEVLAELMEKLRGKLELKATSGSQGEAGPRGELSPNVDRLTVGPSGGFFIRSWHYTFPQLSWGIMRYRCARRQEASRITLFLQGFTGTLAIQRETLIPQFFREL